LQQFCCNPFFFGFSNGLTQSFTFARLVADMCGRIRTN